MKLGAMYESKYLKKEDVGDGMLVTIRAVQLENVALEGQPEDNKPVVYFNETQKGLVLNRTNGSLMIHYLGTDETDQWIGRQVVLYNDPTIQFQGKMVGGIRIRGADQAQTPAMGGQPGAGAVVPQPPASPAPAGSPPTFQNPQAQAAQQAAPQQASGTAPGTATPAPATGQNPAFDDDIPF